MLLGGLILVQKFAGIIPGDVYFYSEIAYALAFLFGFFMSLYAAAKRRSMKAPEVSTLI